MNSFSIETIYPWLLLLIIPALAAVLIPFFRVNKKYRYTRNRVCSVILHSLMLIMAVCLVSGLTFNYKIPNSKNEILILVDMSESEEQSADNRDEFVETLLFDAKDDNYRVSIVTFGFTQSTVVPFTTLTSKNYQEIYSLYSNSELPDISATDIAAALRYSKELFTNPESSKLVLVTDGKETDEKALEAVRTLSTSGTKVEVAYISSTYSENEVQVKDVSYPEYHVNVDEEFNLNVTIESGVENSVNLSLSDNGVPCGIVENVKLEVGENVVTVPHKFAQSALHCIEVSIVPLTDALEKNNVYHSYYYLELFNKVLVLEKYENSSQDIKALLTTGESETDKYEVEVLNIDTAMGQFTTIEQFREYDQIILNNVSNTDMTGGERTSEFVDLLYKYVYDYGGGLLTAGGNDENDDVHLYNREDLSGTVFQSMLPIRSINYTPPVGIVFIIDTSGSMSSKLSDGSTMLQWATTAINSCVNELSDRDYVGVFTFSDDSTPVLPLTPCTNKQYIRETVATMADKATGSTVLQNALLEGARMLDSASYVDKRNIVIISDGAVWGGLDICVSIAKEFYDKNGTITTFAALGMDPGSTYSAGLDAISRVGHGYDVDDMSAPGALYLREVNEVVPAIREEVKSNVIMESLEEPFIPKIRNNQSSLVKDLYFDESATIGGYYGGKARNTADTIIVGDYNVPIYAQWKLGKGMVGSFMTDLNGNWSSQFMSCESGSKFIKNVVANLMPVSDIRPKGISVMLKEDNYINTINVFGNLSNGERIEANISYNDLELGDVVLSLNSVTEIPKDKSLASMNAYVTSPLTESNNYSRATFILKQGGVYTIDVVRYNAENEAVASVTIFKEFAYSKEYDIDTRTDSDIMKELELLAQRGNGNLIKDNNDAAEVFEGFVTALDRTFDPRILFSILIIVMFLTEVAVRKFKFKWLHEIIANYRKNKQ